MPVHNPYAKLGSKLCEWGSGHDAVNVVGTNLLSGRIVYGSIDEAISLLKSYLNPRTKGTGPKGKEASHLQSCIKQLTDMKGLDSFTQGYIDCALWACSDDEGGESFSELGYDSGNISPSCLKTMKKDCADFQKAEAADLTQAGDDSQNGHDFFLTRNGHGAGFWDRGYGAVGDRLSKACKAYGTQDLYLGDDKKIHCS